MYAMSSILKKKIEKTPIFVCSRKFNAVLHRGFFVFTIYLRHRIFRKIPWRIL